MPCARDGDQGRGAGDSEQREEKVACPGSGAVWANRSTVQLNSHGPQHGQHEQVPWCSVLACPAGTGKVGNGTLMGLVPDKHKWGAIGRHTTNAEQGDVWFVEVGDELHITEDISVTRVVHPMACQQPEARVPSVTPPSDPARSRQRPH